MLITFDSYIEAGSEATVVVSAEHTPGQKQTEFDPPYDEMVEIIEVKDLVTGSVLVIDEHERTRFEEEACEYIKNQKEKNDAIRADTIEDRRIDAAISSGN